MLGEALLQKCLGFHLEGRQKFRRETPSVSQRERHTGKESWEVFSCRSLHLEDVEP